MKSDLEMLVEHDMYEHGYDPASIEDIEEYWEDMLNGN
jgi:hypothetical protein